MGVGAWERLPKTSYGNIDDDGKDASEDQERGLLIKSTIFRKVGGGEEGFKPYT